VHQAALFLQKYLFYVLLAVLALNLFQRRYQKLAEKKRFATLYLAMLVLCWMILVIVLVQFSWPDWLLVPFTLAPVAVGVIFRRQVFPFRLRCARCGQSLEPKRILFHDSNACERCDPSQEPPPRL
jgi:multisubunit Na+/H+ antiporter MnhG subunit